MAIIPSEEQANRIAERHPGSKVFWYEAKPSRLTLFGVELPSGQRIITM